MYIYKVPMPSTSYPVGNNLVAARQYMQSAAYKFKKLLNNPKTNIDIYCNGSSGAILSTIFAGEITDEVKCYIRYIRNVDEGERGHFPNYHHSYYNNTLIVIIDDFMSSGRTLNRIYHALPQQFKEEGVFCLIAQRLNVGNIKTSLNFTPENVITNE